jgi:pSer/pThr/pTyr-binding forkhead associated (FHA) protein
MNGLYLVIRHGTLFERIHELSAAKTVVGRNLDCEVWLPNPCISREHAALLSSESGIIIRDLESRNGTRVNGSLLKSDECLLDGADIRIGPYSLKVSLTFESAIREAVDTEESTHSDNVAAAASNIDRCVARLTPAQMRVYDLFLAGYFEKEVALALNLSIHTVHDHAKAIYKLFSVSSRFELIAQRIVRT